ncbi:MAG: hypothetical protein HQ559_12650, partial [Lentisphaerae bacterium]|nr:hypothetical protein [Lentisphaerota bacterium]
MGSVYKKKIVKNGKEQLSEKWHICYFDANGRRRYKTAYRDKQASEQLLALKEREVARGEVGLVDPYAAHRKMPISRHVDDYEKHLRTKGACDKHVRGVEAGLRRAFKSMNISVIGNLTAERAERFLLRLIEENGISKRTRNHRLAQMRSFVRWGIQA